MARVRVHGLAAAGALALWAAAATPAVAQILQPPSIHTDLRTLRQAVRCPDDAP